MHDATDVWSGLEREWRRCLELAWESYRGGSIGVGAVLVDPAGRVVSEGRSRWHEDQRSGRSGPNLAGSHIAHAETEAVASISNERRLDDHTLWTSLEPCLLCTGAIVIAHVGTVRYLGADHLWAGIERLPELNSYAAHRWPARHGPRRDGVGHFGALLPLAAIAREFRTRPTQSHALAAQRRVEPWLADLAETAVDELDAAAATGRHVSDVLASLWARLNPDEAFR